ncbi:hypothetical protein OE766_14455 [Pararhizobium sp. YC-54]|uniref:hypothetical protein n=1 Tax=Pararhizobium sp. YC-54 TaxID=2986920 RepID=UPI0021F6A1F8|nr:hypothetical protein [Pararhizobium sp. YC-54]MCV9999444.1 hypothetical protein [Pararhizobium sp. YC-54]
MLDKVARFAYVLLTRDHMGRYRPFANCGPFLTARAADAAIQKDLKAIQKGVPLPTEFSARKPGVDLFGDIGSRNPNKRFAYLRDSRHQSAAREVMSEISRWFTDLDGNFVKDFQTSGYEARLWELYLFASFKELGFAFDESRAVPDFRLSKGDQKLFVEAVTVNPTGGAEFDMEGPPPPPPADFAHYMEHEMPQKFGSPLFTKTKKAYWNQPDVKGHPFAIAIMDFHSPASMTWSHTALSFYLYGVGVELRPDHPDYKSGIEKKLKQHMVGNKIVATNFFAHPGNENVSAVLFSNAGSVAKFNRMGVLAGFGDPAVKLRRIGGLYDHTPGSRDPIEFAIDIEDPQYEEAWADEIEIYHNPNALVPLDQGLFPGRTHFFMKEGELVWQGPERRVLFSSTYAEVHNAKPSGRNEDTL